MEWIIRTRFGFVAGQTADRPGWRFASEAEAISVMLDLGWVPGRDAAAEPAP